MKQIVKSQRKKPVEHIRRVRTKQGIKPRLINRGNKPSQVLKRVTMVDSPEKAVQLVRGFKIDKTRENMIAIYLDVQLKPIGIENVFQGGLEGCLIDPRTLFRKALFRNAAKMIIIHNHPSGNIEPSSCDKKVFDDLRQGGKILMLPILDSIIINGNKAYSLDLKKIIYA